MADPDRVIEILEMLEKLGTQIPPEERERYLDEGEAVIKALTNAVGEIEGRNVFVGYPYALPKDDYRRVFATVGAAHDVTFVFADEELTNKHVLVKIEAMMRRAAFSLFDITLWNPNVALELGIAYGLQLDYYVLFDPTKGNTDVLSDFRGIDRIEYHSYTELEAALAKLVRDQFGAPAEEEAPEAKDIVAQLDALRSRVPELIRSDPGQPIGGIASSLGVPIELAQTVVKPLIGAELETRGVRRGTRYYLTGEAPPSEDEILRELGLLPPSDDEILEELGLLPEPKGAGEDPEAHSPH